MVSDKENTNRKIIYDVLAGLKEFNADSVYSKRKIWSTIYRKAKFLIDRDARERKLFRTTDSFEPICLELEEVPATLCDCIDVTSCKTLYRSKHKIPKLFQTVVGPVIYSITSLDSSKEIIYSTPISAMRKSKMKGINKIFVFIDNEYLYAFKRIEGLRMTAMFEGDVTQLQCEKQEANSCSPWLDKTTFIPDRLLDSVIQLTLQELGSSKGIPVDTMNDKNPNPK